MKKNKEKLIKSGWQYKQSLDYYYEIYGRDNLRIIYDNGTDKPLALYNVFERYFKMIDDILWEFLTKKQ